MIITDTIRNIPQWAVCYLAYGDDTGITDEDKKLVDDFVDELNKDGWRLCEAPIEGSENSFCSHPAFGLACDTVDYTIYKEMK